MNPPDTLESLRLLLLQSGVVLDSAEEAAFYETWRPGVPRIGMLRSLPLPGFESLRQDDDTDED